MREPELAERILSYIDDLYSTWCERPKNYALNPRCMESVFIELEIIREFILFDGVWPPGRRQCGYFRFLRGEHPEVGVGLCTSQNAEHPGQPSVEDDPRLFATFVEWWREFLASDYRLPGGGEAGGSRGNAE